MTSSGGRTERLYARAADLMSFLRHVQIYHPMNYHSRRERPASVRPRPHRLMSLQLVIPWWDALLQRPPPLRQRRSS
jgi:hypothetical protein